MGANSLDVMMEATIPKTLEMIVNHLVHLFSEDVVDILQ